MKKISIISPCYNEGENIRTFYETLSNVLAQINNYDFEIIFQDNCSTDNTMSILKEICLTDKRVKVIRNVRNFGPLRSSAYLTLQAYGDAVIALPSDMQDPPELIPEFIRGWEEGYKLVLGQKNKSEENKLIYSIRKLYYKLMKNISDSGHIENVGTYILYDQSIIEVFRWMQDPYPYIRTIICDLGYRPKIIPYTQKKRKKGKSSYNLFKYIDVAITGITSSSHVPLRMISYTGVLTLAVAFIFACIYIFSYISYRNHLNTEFILILIVLFLEGAIQLTCIGILGEYIGMILIKVTKRPLVIEEERINFDKNFEEKTK